ncbi:MAG: class I SAM-dependent RNA methyltransferase [Hyphomicrobiaceae bacterium]
MSTIRTVRIGRLGHDGDGVIEGEGAPVYVPFALPGEMVRTEVDGERGRLLEVVTPSADRQRPACRHFASCGGCTLQHMRSETYLAFKRRVVVDAFASRNLTPAIDDVVPIPPGTRRRVVLAAQRAHTGVDLGFHTLRGKEVVSLAMCPVAAPAIVRALPALNRLAEPLLSRRGALRIAVTAADNGLDVAISGGKSPLDGNGRMRAVEATQAGGFLRVTVDDEPLMTLGTPVVAVDGIEVALPPGGFLQAVRESEAELRRRVLEATAGRRRIADLFAGIGTFSLPLARHAEVTAVEGDKAALAALTAAGRRAPGLKPVKVLARDLFREPLARKELEGFDAVVFDPPRQGARAQVEVLANSAVPVVVAVSCNPATLARDVRMLVDGGYVLGRVTPIDQFLYSPHVEVVAMLERPAG